VIENPGRPVQALLRVRHSNGSWRWVEGVARNMVSDPAIQAVVINSRDVTEHKGAQEELEARVRQQAAVAELLQSALAGSDVSTLMDETTRTLAETLDVEFALVFELKPGLDVLRLSSGVGWKEGVIGFELPAFPGTPAGDTIQSLEPVVVEDLERDARFPRSEVLVAHGIASAVIVPVIGQDGPLGLLGAYSTETRKFGPDDVNFLRVVAGVLADGLGRLGAEKELRRTLNILQATDAERRKLLSRLIKAQEEERERIAADIHDDSIQVMTALSLRLQMLKDELTDPDQLARLEDLEKVLEKTIARLRHLLFELRPPALDREGLTPALRDYLEKMTEEDGARYTLENKLVAEPATEARVIVYRIAQEALVNVRKHARASNVDVLLDEREGGVFVTIQDDGRGFEAEVANVGIPGHLGLTAMRERAEMAGGWFKIDTRPGGGTSVQFWVPAEKVYS
jgi:signal transduction histidine kinase